MQEVTKNARPEEGSEGAYYWINNDCFIRVFGLIVEDLLGELASSQASSPIFCNLYTRLTSLTSRLTTPDFPDKL